MQGLQVCCKSLFLSPLTSLVEPRVLNIFKISHEQFSPIDMTVRICSGYMRVQPLPSM